MRSLIWIPFVFLAGLLIGYSGPSVRYRNQKDELEKLRKAARTTGKREDLGGVIDFLRIGSNMQSASGTGRYARINSSTGLVDRVAGSETNSFITSPAATNSAAFDGRERRSLKEVIDEASELWKVRSDIARTSFVQANRLDEEKTAKFDVIVEAMNLRLESKVKEWAGYLSTNDITPEAGVHMVKDMSEIMVVTYDEMDRNMPSGWRESSGKEFDLGSFIDPSVATPMIELEPKLRNRRPFGPGGRSEWRGRRGDRSLDAR